MDRMHKITIGVIGVIIAVLAVTAVTANSSPSATPLYTVRMEQASSEMNFLATPVNSFIYTAEKGYTVNCEVAKICNSKGCLAQFQTQPYDTCHTCWQTCITCGDTCNTCVGTCETCWSTCGYTCGCTCDGWTCEFITCEGYTHEETCRSHANLAT